MTSKQRQSKGTNGKETFGKMWYESFIVSEIWCVFGNEIFFNIFGQNSDDSSARLCCLDILSRPFTVLWLIIF